MLIDTTTIQINDSWKSVLADEFSKPYFAHIKEFLLQEKQAGHIVYPT
jgi:uracil-DNA glycosylase